jgi:hypothetical protein
MAKSKQDVETKVGNESGAPAFTAGGYRVRVKVEGLVPMLHDKYPLNKNDDGSRTKVDPPVESKLHHDKKGVFVPADNLRQMLLGNRKRQGACKVLGTYFRSKKATEYATLVNGALYVQGLEDPQKVYLEPLRKKWDQVDKRAFMSDSGRKISKRPQMNTPWSLEFMVYVYTDALPEEIVKQLFTVAGQFCGIGAYGPKFGRYRIVGWEMLPLEE